MQKLIMKDYAKINTKEPFKWGEAVIGALLLPGVFMSVYLIKLVIQIARNT